MWLSVLCTAVEEVEEEERKGNKRERSKEELLFRSSPIKG